MKNMLRLSKISLILIFSVSMPHSYMALRCQINERIMSSDSQERMLQNILQVVDHSCERNSIVPLCKDWGENQVVSALFTLYGNAINADVKVRIILLLSDLRREYLVDFFSKEVRSDESRLQAAAILALGKQTSSRGVKPIRNYLDKNGLNNLIPYIIDALGLIGSLDAIDTLEYILSISLTNDYWYDSIKSTLNYAKQFYFSKNRNQYLKHLLIEKKLVSLGL